MKPNTLLPALLSLLVAGALVASPAVGQGHQGDSVEYKRTPRGYQITHKLPTGVVAKSHLPSAQQAVDEFEREMSTRVGIGGPLAAATYLYNFDRFPKATVDSVLTGLAHLALNAGDQKVRTAAASLLAFLGDTRRSKQMPGSFTRSLRVYRQARDPMVRMIMLPVFSFYGESNQVIALLKSIAVQTASEEDFPDAPAYAVTALSYMGEEGRMALKQLFESKRVRNPKAGAYLHYLSQRGFREDSQ